MQTNNIFTNVLFVLLKLSNFIKSVLNIYLHNVHFYVLAIIKKKQYLAIIRFINFVLSSPLVNNYHI